MPSICLAHEEMAKFLEDTDQPIMERQEIIRLRPGLERAIRITVSSECRELQAARAKSLN